MTKALCFKLDSDQRRYDMLKDEIAAIRITVSFHQKTNSIVLSGIKTQETAYSILAQSLVEKLGRLVDSSRHS